MRQAGAQTSRPNEIADLENEVVSRLAALTSRTTESFEARSTNCSHFLKQHQDVLATRLVRKVNSKLRTGLKNPRRQAVSYSPK